MFVAEKRLGEMPIPPPEIGVSTSKKFLLAAERRLIDPKVTWTRRPPQRCTVLGAPPLEEECLLTAIIANHTVMSVGLERAVRAVLMVINEHYEHPCHNEYHRIDAWNDEPGREFVEVMEVLREAIEIVDTIEHIEQVRLPPEPIFPPADNVWLDWPETTADAVIIGQLSQFKEIPHKELVSA